MNPHQTLPPPSVPPQPIPVQSETLRALMGEGRREWSITEPWLYALLILMAIDITLGLLAAYRREDIASNSLFDGLRKKATMILLIGTLVVIDPFAPGITLSVIAAVAYVGMEALSIVEKAGKLGVPMPEEVTRVLRALRPAGPPPQNVNIVGAAEGINLGVRVNQPPSDPVPTTVETPH